jgi:GH24 family phage-related lysozyme (muramidase)
VFYRECYECGQRWELGIGSTCKCESIGESMSSSEDGKMTDLELMQLALASLVGASIHDPEVTQEAIDALRDRLKEKNEDE